MHPATILAVTGVGALIGRLLWNLAAGLVMVIAAIRVASVAAPAWPRRYWSKAAWIGAALWLTWHSGGLVLPVGAVAALVQAQGAAQRANAVPPVPDLPMAPGSPWDETNGPGGGR